MPRKYTRVQALTSEVLEMRLLGKTYREIGSTFGLEKEQVRELVKRHNRAQKRIEAGIKPRRRGRPPKGYVPTEQEKDNEIKRLKMENELLRDFLRLAGRR